MAYANNKTGLWAIVHPKKKKVVILEDRKIVKEYSFKMDIPFEMVEKTVWKHNYKEWSVSERDYESIITVKVWDAEIIDKIKSGALEFYKKQLITI